MTPRSLILRSARRLSEAGVPDPAWDAAALLSFLTGEPALNLRMADEKDLSPDIESRYEELIRRRALREPLQYLTGTARFMGLDFKVTPAVLIPRPETELLAEWALEVLRDLPEPMVLDLCCGSGCIGLGLKSARPDAAVSLSDLSSDALTVARENRDSLGLEADFFQGDLFAPLGDARYHLIVSNPPYIPAAECRELQEEVLKEPLSALDGGDDGLDFYRRIAEEAPRHLLPGGTLLLEIGMGQETAVCRLLEDQGAETETRVDFSGIVRMVRARFS